MRKEREKGREEREKRANLNFLYYFNELYVIIEIEMLGEL